MRLFTCVLLLTGLSGAFRSAMAGEAPAGKDQTANCSCRQVNIWGFSIYDDDRDDDKAPGANPERHKHHRMRDEPSRSLADGFARGTLRPFVELTGKQSNPGDEALHLSGLRLGLSENGEHALAFAYYRSRDDTQFRPGTLYSLSYGGVVFGHMPDVDRLVEGYGRLLIGTGQVKVTTPLESRTSQMLYVLEPEIGFGLNVTSWLQIAAGVSYRYLNGLAIMGLGSQDLRGASANLHLLVHF